MKSHSWHPNPLLIKSPYNRLNPWKPESFSETECARGVLGRFYSIDILPLMMAHALKFKKYGA
jgi:2,3-bisphosphoglycerate-independent phosphoglycerate mutase